MAKPFKSDSYEQKSIQDFLKELIAGNTSFIESYLDTKTEIINKKLIADLHMIEFKYNDKNIYLFYVLFNGETKISEIISVNNKYHKINNLVYAYELLDFIIDQTSRPDK